MILDFLVRWRHLASYTFMLVVIGLLYIDLIGTEKKLLISQHMVADLKREVEFQSLAVEAWKANAEKRKAEAEKAMAAAKKQDVVHVTKAQRILVEVPANSDECVSALELLRKYQ